MAYSHLKRGNDLFYEIHRGIVTDIDYFEKRKILHVTLDNTRIYGFNDGEGGYKPYDNKTDYEKDYISFFTGESFNLTRL